MSKFHSLVPNEDLEYLKARVAELEEKNIELESSSEEFKADLASGLICESLRQIDELKARIAELEAKNENYLLWHHDDMNQTNDELRALLKDLFEDVASFDGKKVREGSAYANARAHLARKGES